MVELIWVFLSCTSRISILFTCHPNFYYTVQCMTHLKLIILCSIGDWIVTNVHGEDFASRLTNSSVRNIFIVFNLITRKLKLRKLLIQSGVWVMISNFYDWNNLIRRFRDCFTKFEMDFRVWIPLGVLITPKYKFYSGVICIVTVSNGFNIYFMAGQWVSGILF